MSAQLARQIVSRTATNDSYSWTGHGNGTTSYTVNGLNQRARRQSGGLPRTALATVSGAAAAHDARGNMTTDPATGRSYSYWSSDNQLLRVSSPWTVYGYDPLSRLAYIETGTPVTNFAYDGLEALAEYDQNNALQKRYVFGPGIDEPLVEYDAAGNRRFLEADERGSIILVADGSGSTIATNRYGEYGKPQAGNVGRFQYTGQMWLPRAQLFHYKFRALDPYSGRFVQADPIGYAGGINFYAYVANDPVNLVDRLGLSPYCGTPASGEILVCAARLPVNPAPPIRFYGGLGTTSGGSQETSGPDIFVTATRPPRSATPITLFVPASGQTVTAVWHEYAVERRLTRRNTRCRSHQGSEAVNRNFVPGHYGLHISGESFPVSFGGLFVGTVTFESDRAGTAFANITNEGHPLCCGSVRGSIFGDRSFGFIGGVYGSGFNLPWGPFSAYEMARINETMGSGIFSGQLAMAQLELVSICGG